MKNYYIAKLRVLINGQDNSIETVAGMGYDLNVVKRTAEGRVRELNPGKAVTSVLVSVEHMDLEEYKMKTGGNPNWLGGLQE